MSVLKRGSSGAAVSNMQKELWAYLQDQPKLFEQIKNSLPAHKQHFMESEQAFADGGFGSVTEAAVRHVQQHFRDKGVESRGSVVGVDGKWGPQTANAVKLAQTHQTISLAKNAGLDQQLAAIKEMQFGDMTMPTVNTTEVAATTAAAFTAAQTTRTQTPEFSSPSHTANTDMTPFNVTLRIGHGSYLNDDGRQLNDPGAVYGQTEHEYATQLAQKIQKQLTHTANGRPVNVRIIEGTEDNPLTSRFSDQKAAVAAGSDLHLMLHMNAFSDHSVNGTRIYCHSNASPATKEVNSYLNKAMGAKRDNYMLPANYSIANPRDFRTGNGYEVPAIVAEADFISDPNVRARFDSEQGQNAFVDQFCNSVSQLLDTGMVQSRGIDAPMLCNVNPIDQPSFMPSAAPAPTQMASMSR